MHYPRVIGRKLRYLTSIVFPTLGNWPRVWAPGWGCLIFCEEKWNQVTSSHDFACLYGICGCFGGRHLFPTNTTMFSNFKQVLTLWRLHGFYIYSLALQQTINSKNSNIFNPLTAKNYAELSRNEWAGYWQGNILLQRCSTIVGPSGHIDIWSDFTHIWAL